MSVLGERKNTTDAQSYVRTSSFTQSSTKL